jgi:tetratricopeptide (TPR) repeat protein
VRVSSFVLAGLVSLVCLTPAIGCKPKGPVDPSIAAAAEQGAWAIHETLEARIAAGKASEADRAAALDRVREAADDGTAAHAYARASVAGRVAEGRGLQALDLLEEIREWAEASIQRDPDFEGMAAKRMLGTLYVLAGRHLKKGDSEEGLELLEEVAEAHPDVARNQLRLGEGYVALGDPESAFEALCRAQAGRASLTAEEQKLLDQLIEDAGGAAALGCEATE